MVSIISSNTDDFHSKKISFAKVNLLNFTNLKKNLDKFYDKNKSIDYLINTTGVLWFEQDVSAINIDSNVWDKVFEINLTIVFNLTGIISSIIC